MTIVDVLLIGVGKIYKTMLQLPNVVKYSSGLVDPYKFRHEIINNKNSNQINVTAQFLTSHEFLYLKAQRPFYK